MTEGNFVHSTKPHRRQNEKKRKNKKMSFVEGTWKEETRFCAWKQFMHTENISCTFYYCVVLSIGVGKQITILTRNLSKPLLI